MTIDVAVLGPGGVGGLLAALMSRAGAAVVVIAGDDTARLLAERGIRVESPRFGSFTASVRAATRLAEPVDACFITVKATHLHDALERVPADSIGGALVIPFLNGIDHVDLLRSIYPPASVAPATIRIETARTEPGLIRHTSPFAAIDIAFNADNHERVAAIADNLMAAGFDVRTREDEAQMLWDKFALLAPMALLTTQARASVGVVRTSMRQDLIALVAEIAAIARAEGAVIDATTIVNLIDSIPAAMETSMQRDQAAGRPLELDALGGALVRRASRRGVAAPVARRLVEDLRSRADPARRLD